MPRIRLTTTEAQDQELQRAFVNEKDGATRIRYQAVRLYGQGDAVGAICRITGCSRTSLMEWWSKYGRQGPDGLRDHRDGRNRAKLRAGQLADLRDRLDQYTPRDVVGPHTHTASGQHWTVEDLARAMQNWYGISWKTRASYRTLFARWGFTYQRTEKVYKSRRDRQVAEFEAQVEKN
jgi:transposase